MIESKPLHLATGGHSTSASTRTKIHLTLRTPANGPWRGWSPRDWYEEQWGDDHRSWRNPTSRSAWESGGTRPSMSLKRLQLGTNPRTKWNLQKWAGRISPQTPPNTVGPRGPAAMMTASLRIHLSMGHVESHEPTCSRRPRSRSTQVSEEFVRRQQAADPPKAAPRPRSTQVSDEFVRSQQARDPPPVAPLMIFARTRWRGSIWLWGCWSSG